MQLREPIKSIQLVNADIGGVRTATWNVFTKLDTAALPLVQTWPGNGTMASKNNFHDVRLHYHCEFWHSPATLGTFPRNWESVVELFDNALVAWGERYDDTELYVLDYGDTSGYRLEIDRAKEILFRAPDSNMEWAAQQRYNGFIISIPFIVRWGTRFA